jgi:phosphoribosylformimino-5-aminoimidazole carboxamide ribotide isomerase
MILYPAIDLKAGQCVRLLRGEMTAATVFNDSPGDQAAAFTAAGCEWLHVVDLDGAFAGQAVNQDAVAAIRAATHVPIQLGGGIRDMAAIEMWLEAGINRVILGTAALHNPELVRAACGAFPGQIAVGVDAREGKVAVEGWAETADLSAHELALRFEDCGVAAIIFTDIDRDGALQGVNLAATAALAKAVSTPIIASGGVASLDDLRDLVAHASSGISGVISGRALYDGRLDVAAAVAFLKTAGQANV